MENITPFADAISGTTTTNHQLTEIDILRKSNHELKLQILLGGGAYLPKADKNKKKR